MWVKRVDHHSIINISTTETKSQDLADFFFPNYYRKKALILGSGFFKENLKNLLRS